MKKTIFALILGVSLFTVSTKVQANTLDIDLSNVDTTDIEKQVTDLIKNTAKDNNNFESAEDINSFVEENIDKINLMLDKTEKDVTSLNEKTSELNDYVVYKQQNNEIPSISVVYDLFNGKTTFEEVLAKELVKKVSNEEFEALPLLEKLKQFNYKKALYNLNEFLSEEQSNDSTVSDMQLILKKGIKSVISLFLIIVIFTIAKSRLNAKDAYLKSEYKRIRKYKF